MMNISHKPFVEVKRIFFRSEGVNRVQNLANVNIAMEPEWKRFQLDRLLCDRHVLSVRLWRFQDFSKIFSLTIFQVGIAKGLASMLSIHALNVRVKDSR